MPGPRIVPTTATRLTRISTVLDGVTYPAATWQLVAHAEHYGADAVTRAEIHRLPAATYPDLAAVIATLEQPTPTQATPTQATATQAMATQAMGQGPPSPLIAYQTGGLPASR